MEGRERFANCFVIIVEKSMLWILQFVEKRIQLGQTLEQFINSSYDLRTDTIVKQALPMSSSVDLDVSALWVVIQTGGLFRPGEVCQALKQHYLGSSRPHSPNTEFIYAYCRRNLDESDYDDYINDLKDIGKHFERINGETNGTYTNQIEDMHSPSC